jgi:hypothetical protein
MPIEPNDWRLMGQERYLRGRQWLRKSYRKPRPEWDHDHCSFCQAKFMEPGTPDTLHEGYSTQDDYYWVCPLCFSDFKNMFDWSEQTPTG